MPPAIWNAETVIPKRAKSRVPVIAKKIRTAAETFIDFEIILRFSAPFIPSVRLMKTAVVLKGSIMAIRELMATKVNPRKSILILEKGCRDGI
jgi:hypothetical protein